MLPMPVYEDGEVRRGEYNNFVRTYETRHAELRVEMREIEVEIKSRIDDLSNKVDQMKIDLTSSSAQLKLQVSRQGLDLWKLIATGLLSGGLGYVISLIQHLVFH